MACTGCLTALGFAPGCKRTPGGLQGVLLFAQVCDLEGMVTREGYNGEGKIIAIDPSVVFAQVTARLESLNLTETMIEGSGAFTSQLTFVLEPLANEPLKDDARQTTAEFITNLTNQNSQWVVVLQEKSGVRRLLGIENGLKASGSTVFDSGTANADVATETIVLTGTEPEKAPVIADTVVLTIL